MILTGSKFFINQTELKWSLSSCAKLGTCSIIQNTGCSKVNYIGFGACSPCNGYISIMKYVFVPSISKQITWPHAKYPRQLSYFSNFGGTLVLKLWKYEKHKENEGLNKCEFVLQISLQPNIRSSWNFYGGQLISCELKFQRSWYDFLINGRFSVGSSDRHNIGSHPVQFDITPAWLFPDSSFET